MAGSGLYGAPVKVSPERELMGLVPAYLGRRENDVTSLEEALGLADYGRNVEVLDV